MTRKTRKTRTVPLHFDRAALDAVYEVTIDGRRIDGSRGWVEARAAEARAAGKDVSDVTRLVDRVNGEAV